MGLTDCERQYMVKLRMDKSIRFLEEAKQMVGLKLWDLALTDFTIHAFMLHKHYCWNMAFRHTPMKELCLCLAYIL